MICGDQDEGELAETARASERETQAAERKGGAGMLASPLHSAHWLKRDGMSGCEGGAGLSRVRATAAMARASDMRA